MHKKLALLFVFISQLAFAEENKQVDVPKMLLFKSYSYTLIDEMELIKDSKKQEPADLQKADKKDNLPPTFKNFLDYEKKSEIFSIGILQTTKDSSKYTIGDFSASFYSSRKKGRESLNTSTLHFDYKIAPGVFPYIETKQIDRNSSNDFLNIRYLPNNKKRSTLFLIGTKIEF